MKRLRIRLLLDIYFPRCKIKSEIIFDLHQIQRHQLERAFDVSSEHLARCFVIEMRTVKGDGDAEFLKLLSLMVDSPVDFEGAAATVDRMTMTRPHLRTETARCVSLQVRWLCRRGVSPTKAFFRPMSSLLKRLIKSVISPKQPTNNNTDRHGDFRFLRADTSQPKNLQRSHHFNTVLYYGLNVNDKLIHYKLFYSLFSILLFNGIAPETISSVDYLTLCLWIIPGEWINV